MKFEWDKDKNDSNINKHEIDFGDVVNIFDFPMLLKKDTRFEYGEERWIGLGQLDKISLVIVFTKRVDTIRIISARKANKRERSVYNEKIN